jgi:hypothetical protein
MPASATPTCTRPITIYLENDGRLEHARQTAGHESPRTTKLYDRTKDEVACARWSASDCDVRF